MRSGVGIVPALVGAMWSLLPARLDSQSAEVPARVASRIAEAVGRAWGVEARGLTLAFGTGSLAGVPDTAAFRLLGRGDGGWFAVTFELGDRPSRAIRLRAGMAEWQPVSARALRPGIYLTQDDIRQESRVRWGPPEPGGESLVAAGWIVTRMVSPGDALDRTRVAPAPVVAAGGPVRMRWQQGGVSVVLIGVALNDAAVGDRVRVHGTNRPGVLVGTVTAPGEARMQ